MCATQNARIVRAVMFREQERKGQINIFTQPIMLIILISIFAIFVVKTLEVNVHIAKEAEEYDFKSKAIPVFDEVINCISCDSTRYPYLVSARMLDALNEDYVNNEAPCMRAERLGWSATVRDIDSPNESSWQLGEAEDSGVYGLKHEFGITMPVAIRYEDGSVNAGELNLNLRQGDLESVVGMVEKVYRIGSEMDKQVSDSMTIRLDYPVVMADADGRKSICLRTNDGDFCKVLSFNNLEFMQIEAGLQYIVFKYNHNKKLLRVVN